MKIEITDREHWLERVEYHIRRIEAERRKRDAEYEDEWASSVFGGRLLLIFLPYAKPPRGNRMTSYPSCYAWDVYGTLKDMRTGLLEQRTGAIWFGETEIKAAPPIPQVFPSIERAPGFYFHQIKSI